MAAVAFDGNIGYSQAREATLSASGVTLRSGVYDLVGTSLELEVQVQSEYWEES